MKKFQSTLPVWAATYCKPHCFPRRCNFNPRCPCGQRLLIKLYNFNELSISIHAARVGSDHLCHEAVTFHTAISIHAARVGSDRPGGRGFSNSFRKFQSTLPVWAATTSNDFKVKDSSISIHAARVGSDGITPQKGSAFLGFQSTLPVWAATCSSNFSSTYSNIISIHAARVGSDLPDLLPIHHS